MKLLNLSAVAVVAFVIGYTFTYNCGQWPETDHLTICKESDQ